MEILDEVLDMARLYSTNSKQDICEQLIKVVRKLGLNPANLFGITTDGASSMKGKTNRFTKKFLSAVDAQIVLVSHCIIHKEKMCTRILGIVEDMKNVVQCVNSI